MVEFEARLGFDLHLFSHRVLVDLALVQHLGNAVRVKRERTPWRFTFNAQMNLVFFKRAK